MKKTTEFAKSLWGRITGEETSNSDSVRQTQSTEAQAPPTELGPKERGWYAVNFVKQEGHDFLGQFVVDKDKKVKWVQTERILEGASSFFASGLRTIETKYDLGEDITKGDLFWAAVDVAIVASSLKALRIGKTVAASGKKLSLVSRTRLFASRLLSKSKIFQKMGKYGAVAATAYLVVSHPSLINSALAETAKWMGLNTWLVQFIAWSLIIIVALYPFSWLLKIVARMALFVFSWIEKWLTISVVRSASASAVMSDAGGLKKSFKRILEWRSAKRSAQRQHKGVITQTESEVKEKIKHPSVDSQGTKWFEKAVNLHKANSYAEAIAAYSKTLDINPSYATAHYNRAVIYNKLRKTKNAYEDLRGAARLGHTKSQSFLGSKGMTW